jgi:hypothetical protein
MQPQNAIVPHEEEADGHTQGHYFNDSQTRAASSLLPPKQPFIFIGPVGLQNWTAQHDLMGTLHQQSTSGMMRMKCKNGTQ